ncbi:MAG: DNA polymerase I [Deltaproteobacteria bacterium]|jgi:DNA polymerase-1|nr:DNA polymerase I [Deltaproteobacteria bacterium]
MASGHDPTQTVYLMDASAFIHRAFHALSKFTNRRGEPTGAAYGFTGTLMRLLKDKTPEYLGIVYDSRGKTRRHELYPEYKANRPPSDPDLVKQLGPIKRIVEAMGLPSFEEAGFEADDVIAAYVRRFTAEGMGIVIVSGDKDFYQFLSERVSMYDPDPEKLSAMTMESFKGKFEGIEPWQFLECQALMGDTSDNIPGVPKVGVKKALKLIGEFRSLDELYRDISKVTPASMRDRLIQYEASARLSRKLAYLGEGCPAEAALGDFRPKPRDEKALRNVFEELDFRKFLAELGPDPATGARGGASGAGSGGRAARNTDGGHTGHGAGGGHTGHGPGGGVAAHGEGGHDHADGGKEADPGGRPGAGQTPKAPRASGATVTEASGPGIPAKAEVDYSAYELVASGGGWKELKAALAGADRIAVDVETDSVMSATCNMVGVSLAVGPNRAFYVPVGHRQDLLTEDVNQDLAETLEALRPYLTDPAKALYGQNAKFDWRILARFGLRLPPPAGDPMLASYLNDPDSQKSLDALSYRLLNHSPRTFAETVAAATPAPAPGGKKPSAGKRTFADVAPRAACEYSAEDADLALRVVPLAEAALAGDKALISLYREVELPLEDLLVSMELAGIRADPARLSAISAKLGASLELLEENIWDKAGMRFNVGSPAQVAEVLFDKLGLPPMGRTQKRTALSTDSKVLRELIGLHPVVEDILRHREISKLKSTYTDRLPLAISPRTGRIHTTLNQTSTATGRLSSSDPNLQNIPARTEEGREIRSCFIAEDGNVLVSADYSQIELRVMAELSGDRGLLEAFEKGEDIHRETAAAMFGKDPGEVTPEERSRAKAINFGIIYGQGATGLADSLKIPRSVAQEFIDQYNARFPGVRSYKLKTHEEAARTFEVRTLFGRRRFLAGFRSANRRDRAEAERISVNTPVQGTAADLIKIAMLRAARRLAHEAPEARLILQIHDELLAETPEGDADLVVRILREEMAAAGSEPFFPGAPTLKVQLKVDSSVASSWSHA